MMKSPAYASMNTTTPRSSLSPYNGSLWDEQCVKQAKEFNECYPQMLASIDQSAGKLSQLWSSLRHDLQQSDNQEALARLDDIVGWRSTKNSELKTQLRTLHEVAQLIVAKTPPAQLDDETLLKTRMVTSQLAHAIVENWKTLDINHLSNAVSANLCSLFSHVRMPYEQEIAARGLQNHNPLPQLEQQVMKWIEESHPSDDQMN